VLAPTSVQGGTWSGGFAARRPHPNSASAPTTRPASQPPSLLGRTGAILLLLSLIASAYLMGLAVGSPAWSWLGWISLLPLFLAIRVWAPGTAWLAGGLWGVCLYVFCTTSGEVFPPTIGSLGLLAVVPALYVYLGARLTRWIGFNPLLLGLGWVGVELALKPLGLHQGLLAGPQAHGPLVELVGRLLGYAFVAFLVAFANALLLSIAAEVRLKIGQPRYIPRSDDYRGWLVPQTSLCPSLLVVSRSRPRAPPHVGS